MDGVSPSRWALALVSVPPTLLTIAWLTLLTVSWTTGEHPIWSATPRNLSEAAALRNAAAVVRFVEHGADPNRPGEVRRDLLRPQAQTLTPVEAAAGARDRDVLQVLIEMGAVFDAPLWQRAWCISNAADVRQLLEAYRPPGADDYCDPALYDY
jgi:hypothetical protein